MKIGIASDHGGYKLKSKLVSYLRKKGIDITDYGTTTTSSVDYPRFGFLIGEEVRDQEIDFGIVICTTGIGISIACNKVQGVRCAKVDNVHEAKMCIAHNNANVISLNGKMFTYRAKDIVDVVLKTKYIEEERHQKRIDMITEYESKTKKVSKKTEEITEDGC